MRATAAPKNPFIYGRVLTAADAACARPELEARLKQTIRDDARIALVGDRRVGKSSAVQRTLELSRVPMLRLNYHEVLDLTDVIVRTVADLERFLRNRSSIARKVVPWLREVGIELREIRARIGGLEVQASIGLQPDHLKRVFGYIRDTAARTPLALFIDEIQDIRDRLPEAVGNAALAVMRDEIQQMSKCPVFFAGSSRDSFTLLFTSDASPFFQHAMLVPVDPLDHGRMHSFIIEQFARGHKIEPEAATLILAIAGDSPNDVQHLCSATWAEHLTASQPASSLTVQRALDNVLKDLTPLGEKWLSDLTDKQQRLVFAIAFLEHLGAFTKEFLIFAGVRNPGSIDRALASTLHGKEALLEKRGSKYRFRSRFARLWFVRQLYRVQALIPVMRMPETYRHYLQRVLPLLPIDSF